MQEELKKGIELFRKKQFAKAEIKFLQATQDIEQRVEASEYLVKIAQKQRNVDLKLKRLEELLVISPDNLAAELTLAKLISMKGTMAEYQNTITKVLIRLKDQLLPSALVGKKLLMGIQFIFAGSHRIRLLWELLDIINRTIEDTQESTIPFLIFRTEVLLALNELQEVSNAVEQLKGSKSLPVEFNKLTRIANKFNSPSFPDYNAEKVFCIGLSRTATESLNHALEILGYHSIHWINKHTQNLISENDFKLFDGFTDISVSYQFEKLYYTFPNAKFIFTTRSIESWGRSIRAHYHNSRNISSPQELSQANNALRFEGEAYAAEWNLYAQYQTWEDAFQQFNNRVEHFFSDKPKSKFFELRICDGEGWDKLCPFLEKPILNSPFPNTNQRPTSYKDINL